MGEVSQVREHNQETPASPLVNTRLPDAGTRSRVLSIRCGKNSWPHGQRGIELQLDFGPNGLLGFGLAVGAQRWDYFTGITPRAAKNLTRLYRLASRMNAVPSARQILRRTATIISSCPGAKRHNRLSRVRSQISAGCYPEEAIPGPLQEHVAICAIKAGLVEDAFLALGSIKGPLTRTIRALIAHDRSYAPRLLLSLDPCCGFGLSGAAMLDARAVQLMVEASSWRTHTEVGEHKAALMALARNFDRIQPEEQGSARRYLLRRLVRDMEANFMFELVPLFPAAVRPPRDELVNALIDIPRSSAQNPAHLLMSNLGRFERKDHAEILNQALMAGEIDILRFIPQPLWEHEIDQEAVASGVVEKFGMKRFLPSLRLFTKLGTDFAGRLCREEGAHVLAAHLGAFDNLDPAFAFSLLEENGGEHLRVRHQGLMRTPLENFPLVISNLDRFDWRRRQFGEFVEVALRGRSPKALIENLSRMPEKALQLCEEKYHFLEFRERCKLQTGETYSRFKELKDSRSDLELARFVEDLAALMDKMVSGAPHDKELLAHPWFREAAAFAFPGHSGHWGGGICEDRSADILGYRIRRCYTLDLSAGLSMELKPGRVSGEREIRAALAPVEDAQARLAETGYERDKMKELVKEPLLAVKSPAGAMASPEARLTELMLAAAQNPLKVPQFKKAFLLYHFVHHENIQQYVQGTRDRATAAKTPEYAHLLLLREFLVDRLRDSAAAIAEKAMKSAHMKAYVESAYQKIEAARKESEHKLNLARAQVGKLGATAKLMNTIAGILRSSEMPHHKKLGAVGSIIAKEQRRISELAARLGLAGVESDEVHLQALDRFLKGVEPEPIAALQQGQERQFLVHVFETIMTPERALIDLEIAKYSPVGNPAREARKLEVFVTKNSASGAARAVGGVCVAGDQKMWEMPNFFQMILRDADSLRCEGVIMLHAFEARGKKILTASLNPSSTYLFKVDQKQLFKGLLACLVRFAQENAFDMVACSENRSIRTNRTGGYFELALNERISQVRKRFVLPESEVFSHHPRYILKELDVLWERPALGH